MLELVQKMLIGQYEAALSTLGRAVQQCPAELWSRPVARFPFCQTAYHTLFFTDLYLGLDLESFRSQAFHREHPDLFGDYEQIEDRDPVCVYDKSPIMTYLHFCRAKAIEVITAETAASLAAADTFQRKLSSRAELHLYNIRHIQHHAAQLILKLRADPDLKMPWIGSGWKLPT